MRTETSGTDLSALTAILLDKAKKFVGDGFAHHIVEHLVKAALQPEIEGGIGRGLAAPVPTSLLGLWHRLCLSPGITFVHPQTGVASPIPASPGAV